VETVRETLPATERAQLLKTKRHGGGIIVAGASVYLPLRAAVLRGRGSGDLPHGCGCYPAQDRNAVNSRIDGP